MFLNGGRPMKPTRLIGSILLTLSLVASAPAAELDSESPPERLSWEELRDRAQKRDWEAVGITRGQTLGIQAHSPSGLDWDFLGPRPIQSEYWSNSTDASGRISAILPHPTDPATVYVAAALGGVWRTTDAGATWKPLTDALSSLSSGALCFKPGDPGTIYYATGEQHGAIDNFPGDGLFRTTDAGATWTKIAGVGLVGSYIARVVAHPTASPNVLYLASDAGLRRSTDAGASWTGFSAGSTCTDVVFDPSNGDVVYSAHWGKGIYKSVDRGVTNLALTTGLPAAGSGFGRIQIAIAPSNPLLLYASYHSEATQGLYGFYKTVDGGLTWTQIPGVPNYLGSQGWYDHTIIVNPTDANLVFAGGVYPYGGPTGTPKGVVRSLDGGLTWLDVTAGTNGQTLHPDQHILAYDAAGRLWVGNDGGVWYSADHGTTWVNCNTDLEITQFYFVGVHPSDQDRLLGGTQDNGTLQYSGTVGWPQWEAGDGGATLYDQDDPGYYYTSYVRLNPTSRWLNFGYDANVTGPWASSGDRASFIFSPLIEDPNFLSGLLAGTYRVWRSTNRGTSWTAISGDLTSGGGVLYALAVAESDANTIYAGSTDAHISVTTNGGASWNLRDTGQLTRVRRIALDPLDPSHAYCVQEGRNAGRVFSTTDAGLGWSDITTDLPAGALALCLAVDWRASAARLYLGTDRGVYVSHNGGASWLAADTGLPNTVVYDLAVDETNDWILAATHGRGMWRAFTDLTPPLVTVVFPNGGETLNIGADANLQWSATDGVVVASVDLELSRNGLAGPWETIATGVANTGSHLWNVTGPATLDALLRVTARDNSTNTALDVSDAVFRIRDPVVAAEPAEPAAAFALGSITPNPTAGTARIEYMVPTGSRVRVALLDIQGREIARIADGQHRAGHHVVVWDGMSRGGPLRAGLYFVRLQAPGVERIQRLVVAR
jgi:photosystem II stability/assembly factor-like uncharacterized protein